MVIRMHGYILLLIATAFGFVGAPWWTALCIGAVLTLATAGRIAGLAGRANAGHRVLTHALVMSAANNSAFAVLSLVIGRAAAWLALG